jgi:hypothetical protein
MFLVLLAMATPAMGQINWKTKRKEIPPIAMEAYGRLIVDAKGRVITINK